MLLTNWFNNIRRTFVASNIYEAVEYTIYENLNIETKERFYTVIVRERLSGGSSELIDKETKSFETMDSVLEYIQSIHDLGI